ncbi:fructose-1-phosphate kinase PfkB-like protein [Microbacterium resistens]|uniref:Fructose-1-phosphate kinase PfkB-like protein n=1 Tax=Microbacterium resistens TaxID=156977 RepID=A0ABU1SBE6_9MICO|nr:PfkB family carbohydrate kinase [Microbacterium resistens]MDR6866942.1 fructose-1-phosphate kinase PfkB-like protein [Microbacterium resistens]
MIVTVTPNPALDLTWHVDRIVHGGTHRADTGRSRAGGKGLNVARVAHAAGAAVSAVTTVGGATGGEFAIELVESGVPNVLVPVAAATRRSIALVDESLGDTTVVNERGENPTPEEWDALHAAVGTALAEAGHGAGAGLGSDASEGFGAGQESRPVLVVSGSVPPGAPDDLIPALIAQGRVAGAEVIADTSGSGLLRAADARASVLKPNAAELVEATGIADPVDGARSLLQRGAGLVLLSLGADGMLAVSEDGLIRARLAEPLAGNPTGAGDAAVAAVAVLLAQGERDPEILLRRASAWSASAVLMPLAGEIHDSWPALESALLIDRKDFR